MGHTKTLSSSDMADLIAGLLAFQTLGQLATGLGDQTPIRTTPVDTASIVKLTAKLARDVARTLSNQEHDHFHIGIGDGSPSSPGLLPFDKSLVTHVPALVTETLLYQFQPSDKMGLPGGIEHAQLLNFVQKQLNARLSTKEMLHMRIFPILVVH